MTTCPGKSRHRSRTTVMASERHPELQRPARVTAVPASRSVLAEEDLAMNGEQLPSERKADLARAAVSNFVRSAAVPGQLFSRSEREPDAATELDRLASLLCGLMHYADSSRADFDDALNAARGNYLRERPAYLPGDPVRCETYAWSVLSPPLPPMNIGEVLRSRQGQPTEYEVDLIVDRAWIPESELTPGPQFPAVTTSGGTITCAHDARQALIATTAGIEVSFTRRWDPHQEAHDDQRALLGALSDWTGISPVGLLLSLDHEIESLIRPQPPSPVPAVARPTMLSAICFPYPGTRAAVPPELHHDTLGHTGRSSHDEQPRRRTCGMS